MTLMTLMTRTKPMKPRNTKTTAVAQTRVRVALTSRARARTSARTTELGVSPAAGLISCGAFGADVAASSPRGLLRGEGQACR